MQLVYRAVLQGRVILWLYTIAMYSTVFKSHFTYLPR